MEKRRNCLRESDCLPESLCHDLPNVRPEDMKGSVENFIGFTHMPVGVIEPLRINGLHAQGDFYVPLATTEGAMVASYHRGAHVVSRNNGVITMCVSDSISRAPYFTFDSVVNAALFIEWALSNLDKFKELTKETTSHGSLVDIKSALNSNTAFLIFEFRTAEASVGITTMQVNADDYLYVSVSLPNLTVGTVNKFTWTHPQDA